ncbi:MAG TPA: HlyD family efflux transporter periplasmic adaptor subunit [Prolixibacteraceae bacterium]|nr:HlyD family efflux transporter periplasmic adaptor subunit [Prolixibacteraceae bacterium]HQN93248.1 HlyD family efflux transporter periplasmic adaptor subunit [Prolixibacteraceae bacterium]HUM88057.1 HlyD family efflux transporter periplasmic adaptor subunit [Prolixibacteraceae bacterium]
MNRIGIIVASLVFLYSCGKSNEQYDASGTFEATEIMVSSEASGKILQFGAQEGELLQPGNEVVLIDTLQLFLKKQQLLASINALQSRRPEVNKQIAAVQQQIVTAKTEKQRAENLVKANAANQKMLDDINAQIVVLEKQLAAQKSTLDISNRGISEDVATMEIQVAQLDDQLLKCRIASPINGTLLVKYAQVGELAMPGKALFKVADMESMILRAYITSDQLTQLKIGQTVKVFADFGESTREYSGTISWVSGKAEFTPKTIQTKDERANLVYAVKIAVKNDGYLKIGMYGQIKLTVDN